MADIQRWRASTAYIEPVSKLLRSLKLNKSLGHVTIASTGLKVQTFSPSRSFTAQLFLESSLFATYEFEGDEVKLALSLTALVHCLQMFIEWSPSEDLVGATGCFLDYAPGQKFNVSFAYDTMTSVCDLTAYGSEGNDVECDLAFDVDQVALQVILPASVFASVLRDLDALVAKEVTFLVSLDPPQFEVKAQSDLATTEFLLPNEPNVLEALAAETEAAFTYDFASLSRCREAVRLAKRVSLRFDANGVLSIQCLCDVDGHNAYIEFRFLSKFE